MVSSRTRFDTLLNFGSSTFLLRWVIGLNLAQSYPPALDAMRHIRDETEDRSDSECIEF